MRLKRKGPIHIVDSLKYHGRAVSEDSPCSRSNEQEPGLERLGNSMTMTFGARPSGDASWLRLGLWRPGMDITFSHSELLEHKVESNSVAGQH